MHRFKQRFPGCDRWNACASTGFAKGAGKSAARAQDKLAEGEGAGRDSYDLVDFLTIAAAALVLLAAMYPRW